MRGLLIFFLFMPMLIFAQAKNISNFIFGHSLIDHRPPAIPTPSDETTVPHWVFLLAEQAGHSYAAGGQYGFLPQHQNTPPISQWGYDIVPGVWESDYETFEDTDINTIIITAGNFIQYQPPNEEYYNEDGTTPISATERIVDYVGEKDIYIYENWPDMAGFIEGEGFPPSADELTEYNSYTEGDFHEWWLEYQDALLLSRPTAKVRMVPVGPIIAMLSEGQLGNIDINELYEDNAPHGRANIYFLAGLITYMAIYGEPAPMDYVLPEILSPELAENYEAIVEMAWNYLLEFNDLSGESRVFAELPSKVQSLSGELMVFYPNPVHESLNYSFPKGIESISIRNVLGQQVYLQRLENREGAISLVGISPGVHVVSAIDSSNKVHSQTIVIQSKL